jgi:hypothetical protein
MPPELPKIGDLNRNKQKLICKTRHPGTGPNQYAWIVYCTKCKFLYGVNGADFFERLCPNPDHEGPGGGGVKGLPLD